jgi:hypothetical protein
MHDVVDLVLRVAGNEEHSTSIHLMHHSIHRDVVLTPRGAAEQILPLGLAPHSDLLTGPRGHV